VILTLVGDNHTEAEVQAYTRADGAPLRFKINKREGETPAYAYEDGSPPGFKINKKNTVQVCASKDGWNGIRNKREEW
jgi:hypothetical protein